MDANDIKDLRAAGKSDEAIAIVLAELNPDAAKLRDAGMPAKAIVDNIAGVPQVAQISDEDIERAAVTEVRPDAPADDASIGRIVAGAITEAAIAEGSKAAGTAIGAKLALGAGQVGPLATVPEEAVTVPSGATIGYMTGATIGGVTGSLAAQKIEGNKEISWGRVVSDTMMNWIPGGKLKKGPKILQSISAKAAARPIAANMITGAVTSPVAQSIESLIETGEMPTPTNMAIGSGTSVVLGAALGVGQKQAQKLMGRFAGKRPIEIDDMVARGDGGAIALVNALTEGVEPDVLRKNLDAEGVRKYLFSDMTKAKFAPSKLVGDDAAAAMRSAKWKSATGTELGGVMNRNIKDAIQKTSDPIAAERWADEYLLGRTTAIPQGYENIADQLTTSRKYIREYQEELLKNHHNGQRPMPDAVKNEIERSLNDGDYVTRAYRFFDDPRYQPTEAQDLALRARLEADGMDKAQVNTYIAELNAKKSGSADELAQHVFSQNAGVLKARKDIAPEVRAYLGEYTSPGERVASTMSKLARLTAYDTADNKIALSLSDMGLLRKAGDDLPRDFVPINLRRGAAHLGDDALYGPPELQHAIDSLYGAKTDDGNADAVQKAVSDLWQTTTSASKAVKVLGNPPSYLVQAYGNTISVLGMGANPLKGLKRGLKMGVGQFADGPLSGVAGLRSATDIDYFKRVKELGQVPQGLAFADLQAGLNEGPVGNIVSKVFSPLGKLYSIPDIALRLTAFEHHKSLIRKAAVGADEKALEELAAQMTNNTYQNYDFLNSNLKTASRYGLPLSQFASFSMELARTQYNQGVTVKKMISGELAEEMSKQLGVKVDPKVLRNEGIKRAAALTTIYAGGAAGLTMANRSTMTEEQENALKETVLPTWDENAPVAMHRSKDGKVSWMNSTYLVPHMQLAAPFMSGMRGESMSDALLKVAETSGDGVLESGGFTLKAVSQALQNYDVDKQRQISIDPNQWNNVVDRAAWASKDLFKPGIMREYEKSKSQSLGVTISRQAGIRINQTDEPTGFGFKVRDIKEQMTTAKAQLSTARYGRFKELGRVLGKDELGVEYEMINQPFRAQQSDLIKHVNNMRVLGHSDDAITKMLSDSKIGAVATLNAIDGRVEDIPVVDRETMTDAYERMLSESGDMFQKIIKLGETDPALAKSMASHHKQVVRDTQMNVSERDLQLRKLGVSDGQQARFVWNEMKRSDRPEAILEGYMRKKVISIETARQIELLRRAETQR